MFHLLAITTKFSKFNNYYVSFISYNYLLVISNIKYVYDYNIYIYFYLYSFYSLDIHIYL